MLTLFGVDALTFMMLMYALERRGQRFILAFACGCLLSRPMASLPVPGPSASWS
jgi:hypothetical protein